MKNMVLSAKIDVTKAIQSQSKVINELCTRAPICKNFFKNIDVTDISIKHQLNRNRLYIQFVL